MIDDDVPIINETPFGDIYTLQRSYGIAILSPTIAAMVFAHRAWLWGLPWLALCVADFFTARHRYLGEHTPWFYPRVLWNIIVQAVVLGVALIVGRSWISFLGMALACIWFLGSGAELRKFATNHRIPL